MRQRLRRREKPQRNKQKKLEKLNKNTTRLSKTRLRLRKNLMLPGKQCREEKPSLKRVYAPWALVKLETPSLKIQRLKTKKSRSLKILRLHPITSWATTMMMKMTRLARRKSQQKILPRRRSKSQRSRASSKSAMIGKLRLRNCSSWGNMEMRLSSTSVLSISSKAPLKISLFSKRS